MILRTGTLTVGSPIITALRRTSDFMVGLYAYGTGISIDARISTIDSDSQVTLDRPATAAGATALEFTTAQVGPWQDRTDTLIDIKNHVDERGDLVQIVLRTEAQVDRDLYNSIEKRYKDTKYSMKAFPVTFNPSDRQLEKAGLRERGNVLIYTAMKDWMNAGVAYDDILLDLKPTVHLQGSVYEIREKGLFGQVNDWFGYINLGLFKR